MRRVLFFVEPYPIRNDFTHYRVVAERRWGNVLERWHELGSTKYRLFCNQLTYRGLVDVKPSLTPFALTTTAAEEAVLRGLARPWNDAGIAAWRDLIEGRPRPEFAVIEDILGRIHAMFPFDTLVMWGANHTVAQFCRRVGARPVYMELAPFRSPLPHSWYLDPVGVNGHHSAAELTVDEMAELAAPVVPASTLLERAHNNPLASPGPFDGLHAWLPRGGGRRLLVPLQIYDDVNILQHSRFDGMNGFVEHVLASVPGDWRIVFKPHPGATSRGGVVLADHVRARRRVLADSRAEWQDETVEKGNYFAHLRGFDGVISINSSVALEAMMVGVPAVALGATMYRPKGAIDSIADFLAALDGDRRGLLERQRMIAAFLFKTVFLKGDVVEADPSVFEKRIEAIHACRGSSDVGLYYRAIAASHPYQTWFS